MAGSRQTNVWDAGGGTPMVLQETNREDLLRFSSNPNDTAVYRTRSEYTYVYGLGLVSVTDGQGNQRYALPDALGSVRTLSNGADGSPYATYSYDANGNLTGRTPGGGPTDIFMYDHENRLTQSVIGGVTSSSTYNGDGLRMSHTVSGQTATYTWDVAASLPVVLQDNTYTYVYGLDLISATDSGGNQNYYMYNGLGSVTNIVDYSGNEKALYFYDAFGNPRYTVEFTSNVWRYTGEQRDADSGLYYLRARYYDPSIGRFLGRDPAGAGHPYAYVENNPVNFVDPSGLCHQELGYDQICRMVHDMKEGGMKWCRVGWDCSVPPPPLEGSWYWDQYQCTEGGCVGVMCYDIPASALFSETRHCEDVSRPDKSLVDQVVDFLNSCTGGIVRTAIAFGVTVAVFIISKGTSSPDPQSIGFGASQNTMPCAED